MLILTPIFVVGIILFWALLYISKHIGHDEQWKCD